MPRVSLSVGFWRLPSLSQASLLSSVRPRPYRLAVCPLASSLCLPTWLAFSSVNKGGVQFWAVPDSSYPTPTPFPFPGVCLCLAPPLSLTLYPVSGRPLGSERPLSTVPGRREAEILGWHPFSFTLWLPFLSSLRPLKLHLSRLEAAPLPIVWPGFGSCVSIATPGHLIKGGSLHLFWSGQFQISTRKGYPEGVREKHCPLIQHNSGFSTEAIII